MKKRRLIQLRRKPLPQRAVEDRKASSVPMAAAEKLAVEAVADEKFAYERYIVGSFQVKIPVSTAKAMLPAEETTLAILMSCLPLWEHPEWFTLTGFGEMRIILL